MSTLDYERSSERPNKWLRRVAILLFVAAAGAALVPVVWVTAFVMNMEIASRKFREAYPESQIVGKSPAEILARYGPPHFRQTHPDGTDLIAYAQGWEYCGIEFKDGKATKVTFWGK